MSAQSEVAPLAPTRIRQKAAVPRKTTRWSPEEDHRLVQIVSGMTSINWNEIVLKFPGKTVQQVSERWNKVVDPSLIKGSWTRHEDEVIIDFVQRYGSKNWTKLATLLPGRIGKQCRERWRNHLDPGNNHNPWTPEEDAKLVELHAQYGNQWVKIAQLLPGRSDNTIKNRWNSTLKKHPARVEAKHSSMGANPTEQVQIAPPPMLDVHVPYTSPDPVTWSGSGLMSPSMGLRSPFGLISPFATTSGGFLSPISPSKGSDGMFSPRFASPTRAQNESLFVNLDE